MAGPTSLPSRRTVLGAALTALAAPVLGACTRLTPSETPSEPSPPEPDPPDVLAADRAAGRERRLLAAYDAAVLIAPQLADRLLPLRGDHVAHLAALGLPEVAAGAEADPSAAPTGEPAPPPPPAVAAPRLPQDPDALLGALADLERRAATAHGTAAVLGGRGIGALLASMSASEASHVVALS